MKTTSNWSRPQNIKSRTSQQPPIGSYSNFKLKLRLPKIKFTNPWIEDDLQWKTTSKYQKGKSQQPLYGLWLMSSYGEFRGKLRGNLKCGYAQPSLFIYLFQMMSHKVYIFINCIHINLYQSIYFTAYQSIYFIHINLLHRVAIH